MGGGDARANVGVGEGGREAGLGHAVFCGRERRGLACMHFFS
jgi:hypothetical protein